jgi:hypothetical protein
MIASGYVDGRTDPPFQFAGTEQPRWLGHAPLALHPVRLNRIRLFPQLALADGILRYKLVGGMLHRPER